MPATSWRGRSSSASRCWRGRSQRPRRAGWRRRRSSEQGVTYADKLTRADRRLDPAEPARAAHDRVRALAPHIGAQLRLGGQDVVVWRTEPSPSALTAGEVATDGLRIVVGFGDGALAITELQAPGKRRMDAPTFLRGWRGELGPATRLDP